MVDNQLGEWEHGLRRAELETLRAVDFHLEPTRFGWQAPEYLMPAEGAQATAGDQGQFDERQGPCNARRADTHSAREAQQAEEALQMVSTDALMRCRVDVLS